MGGAPLCISSHPPFVEFPLLALLGALAGDPSWVAGSAHLLYALSHGPHRQLVQGLVEPQAEALSQLSLEMMEVRGG